MPDHLPGNPFVGDPATTHLPGNPFAESNDQHLPGNPFAASQPNILERGASAVGGFISDLYHHPQHILTQPLEAAADALFTPVEGSTASGIGGRGGRATLPQGTVVTPENTPGAISDARRKQATLETMVNVGAGVAGGAVGRAIAPKVGRIAGQVLGRTATNATGGALENPTDPVAGAIAGGVGGELLHHAIGGVAPVLERAGIKPKAETAPTITAEDLPPAMQGADVTSPLEQTHVTPTDAHADPLNILAPKSESDYKFTSARMPSGAHRDFSKVTTDGLIQELNNLDQSRVSAEQWAQYNFIPDDNFHATEDGRSVMSATRSGPDGITNQSKARRNFEQNVGVTSRIMDELESRGVDDIPGVMKKYAREAALDPDVDYVHSGLGIIPEQARNIKDFVNTSIHAAADAIRPEFPDLAMAGESAIASKANAQHIGTVETRRVTDGIDPDQAAAFLPQLQLDRLNDLAIKNPGLVHDATFAQNLSDLQSQIPKGFTESPEFKTMLERYRSGILSKTEPAALQAGLRPEQFANLPNAYVRLVSGQDAPPGTYAESVGGTGSRPNPSTQLTTAQKATGTGAYTNSLEESVTADAMDKIVKAKQNAFYQQLLKTGTVLDSPRETVPAGQSKIMFDDRANVISDPSQAKITFAVPKKVAMYAGHVNKEINRSDTPTSPAGAVMQKLDRGAASLALAVNPAAATTHGGTLSNIVGSTPTPGAPLKALAGMVPFGKSAMGLHDILSVDRTSPQVQALEDKLSEYGGLRPESQRISLQEAMMLQRIGQALKDSPVGKINPHDILFGENGIDKKARLVLAQRFIDSETRRTGNHPAWGDVAQFVNKKAGNYIAGNSGALTNALQRSKMSLFARMATARLSNAGRMLTGNTGMPGIGNRIQGLALGAPGALVGLDALNYMLSGHHITQNQPGHHLDIQYGKDDKGAPKYIRGSFLDPLVSTAINRTGLGSLLFDRNPGNAARDLANTALSVGMSHPLTRAGFGAAFGHEPYITPNGDFKSIGHPSFDEGQGELSSRAKAVGLGLTSVGQSVAGTMGKNPGMNKALGGALGFLMPAITTVGSPKADPALSQRMARFRTALDDRTWQLKQADPADRAGLLKQFKAEIDASDFPNVQKVLAKQSLDRIVPSVLNVRQIKSDIRARQFRKVGN